MKISFFDLNRHFSSAQFQSLFCLLIVINKQIFLQNEVNI